MNSVDTNEVLNFLSVLHCRSLPSYLVYAPPWAEGQEEGVAALNLIAAAHQRTSDRLAELIIENRGDVSPGEFPMTFTSMHDLSISYLLKVAIDHQRRMIEKIQACVDQLGTAPLAKGLAEEALGEAQGHLEALEEVVAAQA